MDDPWTGPVTSPGIYAMDEAHYHSDPVPEAAGGSLSVSGAKLLLPPSVPAKFAYAREHDGKGSDAMDTGTVVHGMVLGTGQEVEVIHADDWRKKAVQEQRDEAAAAGKLPMLARHHAEARAIADAVLKHPVTGALFAWGDAEQSMFWRDEEFGIWLRGRMDLSTVIGDVPTIVDLKTSKDASKEGFAKAVADYGYHRQDPHYREGLAAVLGCDWRTVDFIFAVVETEPPYLVATYRVSDGTEGPDDITLGREQNRIAREVYADCTRAGVWPGYSEEIENLPLRHYDRQRIERQINDWHR
jgi:hypothetical protein